MDEISFVETKNIEEYIDIILRQTDYTREKALIKLEEFKFDHIKVIKDYMGITEKKEPPVKSVNQEVYKQMRVKLNSALDDFKDRKDKKETKF